MSRSGATSPRIEYSPSTTTRRLRPLLSPLRQPLELLAQALGRVVAEADDLRRRLARRVVDARVAVAVDQDHIVGPAEAADEREVRLVAGAEDDRVTLAEPVGELPLEILVQRERAVGGPRSGRAGAVLLQRALSGGDDVGVQREPEIIVRAEHQRRPPLHDDLAGTEHAIDRRSGLASRRRPPASRSARSRPAACREDPSAFRPTAPQPARPRPQRFVHQLTAFVSRFRRRALHFAARRPADRAARHEHDVDRRRDRTDRSTSRRIASVSAAAGHRAARLDDDHDLVGTSRVRRCRTRPPVRAGRPRGCRRPTRNPADGTCVR